MTINGGTVGFVGGGYAYNTISGTATASGNSVFINGGTILYDVYGGVAQSIGGSSTATNNTVTISGNPVFVDTLLYGGRANGDAFSGNTLNLRTPIAVNSVASFQNLNFHLPATMPNGGAMITIGAAANIADSTINVSLDGARQPLAVDDPITLMDATNGNLDGTPSNTAASGLQGVTLKYDFDIATDNGELRAIVTRIRANPQAKALSEGFLAGTLLTNRAGDLLSEQGMANAVYASRTGFGMFGALSGGWSRSRTGSHVDMSSVSLLAGAAWSRNAVPGHLTTGVFLEHGQGWYDTENSFVDASVRGEGQTRHLGAGVFGRMDFAETGTGNFHAEGSIRAGGMRNDHDSDLTDATGRKADYDSSSAYFGAHIGGGYNWTPTDRLSLDFSGRYFWTHRRGDSVTLSTNAPVKFENMNSHRARIGVRLSSTAERCVKPYIGVSYEHEFAGSAEASSHGFAIAAPSLRGGTGIAEAGLSISSRSRPLTADLNMRGYAGKRSGVTGSLRVGWAF